MREGLAADPPRLSVDTPYTMRRPIWFWVSLGALAPVLFLEPVFLATEEFWYSRAAKWFFPGCTVMFAVLVALWLRMRRSTEFVGFGKLLGGAFWCGLVSIPAFVLVLSVSLKAWSAIVENRPAFGGLFVEVIVISLSSLALGVWLMVPCVIVFALVAARPIGTAERHAFEHLAEHSR